MKNAINYLCILFFFGTSYAQVGINTIDPKATLDMVANNRTAPTNTDGVLIPRIDEFPATNPGANQDGMMVFVTGSGTPPKGFYYWDSSLNSWTSATGAKELDDLVDGITISSSTYLGLNAGINDDGTNNYNTGMGRLTLQSNTSGDDNSAFGYAALGSTTTGSDNTAIGESALSINTTGSRNVAIGELALGSNTTASNNIAIGARSLYSNTTGSTNVAVGYSSLYNNTLGGTNTAVGYNSMLNNTEGGNNTALGYNALSNITTQSHNIAIGSRALQASNPTGSITKNTAVGGSSFAQATTAVRNVGLGYYTGYRVTTGISNVAIGTEALEQNQTGSFNTAVGDRAGQNPSGTNMTGNTFLGYFSGRQYLGNNNILLGPSTGDSGSGDYNVYIGHNAGRSASGSNNIFLGRLAGDATTGSNTLMIENSNLTGIDNALVYGEFDNDIFRINGELQIGNPTSTGYVLPTADGTANQVLSTDGSGQLSFTTPVSSGGDADWFLEGTTTTPSSITDNVYTQGNVAIGKNTADSPLDIEVTGSPVNLIALKMVDNSTGTGDHIGMQQTLGGSHNESIKAIENFVTNTGSGLHTGISTSVQNGTGNQVGNRSIVNGSSGTNSLFSGAIFNSGSGSSSTQTGIGLSIQQPSSQISYGSFNTLSASGVNATGTKYGVYNLLDGGSGDHFGVYNDIRGTESNTKYGTYNLFGIGTTDTGGELYGTFNSFGASITSTSNKYGMYTSIPSTLSGTHYGSYVDAQSATGYAGYFIGRTSFGNTNSNRYTMPAIDGAAGQVLTAAGDGTTSWEAPAVANRSIIKGDMNAVTQVLTGTTTLNFDNILIDTNSEYDISTHRFTAAQAGYYKVTLGAHMLASTATYLLLNIRRNSTKLMRVYRADATQPNSHNTSTIVELNVGDYLEFYATVFPASDSVTISGYSEYTHLEIHRID